LYSSSCCHSSPPSFPYTTLFRSVHMDMSCLPGVSADFDRALALLHNFWYARALEAFTEVAQRDPDCAIAYWGAAKTYDHPFWDPDRKSTRLNSSHGSISYAVFCL